LKVRKEKIRFVPLRNEVDPELLQSVEEHGVLVPPLLLRLTEDVKRRLKTKASFLCIDGFSRFEGVPDDAEVDCHVISEDELLQKFEGEFKETGLAGLPILELARVYSLRLHALRQPLPRQAYVGAAKSIMGIGVSLRGVARLLGLPKSTLKDWLDASHRPLGEGDLEAKGRKRRECELCGTRTGNPQALWFCLSCKDEAIRIIARYRARRERN
jgi:hypothetical protein